MSYREFIEQRRLKNSNTTVRIDIENFTKENIELAVKDASRMLVVLKRLNVSNTADITNAIKALIIGYGIDYSGIIDF